MVATYVITKAALKQYSNIVTFSISTFFPFNSQETVTSFGKDSQKMLKTVGDSIRSHFSVSFSYKIARMTRGTSTDTFNWKEIS